MLPIGTWGIPCSPLLYQKPPVPPPAVGWIPRARWMEPWYGSATGPSQSHTEDGCLTCCYKCLQLPPYHLRNETKLWTACSLNYHFNFHGYFWNTPGWRLMINHLEIILEGRFWAELWTVRGAQSQRCWPSVDRNFVWKKEPCEPSGTKPDEGAGKGLWEGRWRKEPSDGLAWLLRAYSVSGAGETKKDKYAPCLGEDHSRS